MKTFKVLKMVFLVLAAILFLASLVVCGLNFTAEAEAEPVDIAFMASITSFVGIFALATVGVFLMPCGNEVARKVGHGLTISSHAIGLTIALTYINSYSIAAVLMLIAVIMLALQYLCAFVLCVMRKNSPDLSENPDDDVRVVRIREWKRIMEEGIISPEEYEEKRQQILGIKTKDGKKAPVAPTTK